MAIEPRPIFARDLKSGMVVTPWSQTPGSRTGSYDFNTLEVLLVGTPHYSHIYNRTTVDVVGWLMDPWPARVARKAYEFMTTDAFAVLTEPVSVGETDA